MGVVDILKYVLSAKVLKIMLLWDLLLDLFIESINKEHIYYHIAD